MSNPETPSRFEQLVERFLHQIMLRFLILLDLKDVMPMLIDDLFGDTLLTTHRIDRNHRIPEVQQFQESRNRLDFIAFLAGGQLPQNEAIALGIRAGLAASLAIGWPVSVRSWVPGQVGNPDLGRASVLRAPFISLSTGTETRVQDAIRGTIR